MDQLRQSGLASADSLPLETFKGRTATATIRAFGYASDPDAFWAYYEENEAVINRYWGHLDAGRVAYDLANPRNAWVAGALGVAIGAAGMYLYTEMQESK